MLVNNAGINDPADGPPSKTSIDAVRRVFDVNVFGVLAVTQAMLPLLRKSASARIVNVSSTLGSLSLNSDPTWEFAQVKITGYNTLSAANLQRSPARPHFHGESYFGFRLHMAFQRCS